jgi:HK97 family phage prohead protease
MRDPLELVALRAQIPVEEVRKLEERRTWNSRLVVQTEASTPEQRAAESPEPAAMADSNGELRLTGYSAVFDSDSELLYGFIREQVKRGAFKKVLKSDDLDVRLLENHEGRPHARTTNGTLKLWETPRGLARDAVLDPERQDSRDLYRAVDRGDYTQSSFAFRIARSEWRYCDHVDDAEYRGCDCVWERDILEVAELLDDSVVTYPAYPAASAEVARSADEPVATQVTPPTTTATVARESETAGERNAPASDEEQRDTAPDADTSPTPSVSDPTSQRRRRARLARIKGITHESGNHGGAR